MFDFITKGIAKVFGTKAEKDLKEILPYTQLVKDEFNKIQTISDEELRQQTAEFKGIIAKHVAETDSKIAGLHKQIVEQTELTILQKEGLFKQIDELEKQRNQELEVVLMEILPRAFAVVKETSRRLSENGKLEVLATEHDIAVASRRMGVVLEGDKAIWLNKWLVAGQELTWNMVHYDVQLIGGVALHQGKISEMGTGEGKTLVATLPAYLRALAGRGVHIVTVNDYLAKRDSEWMAPLMEFHGLLVDCIDKHQPNTFMRRQAYLADITYGTNNEFGFDYLRDNMVRTPDELVQRKHYFAMVDEVDSVLIDDARTPLIISGPMMQGSDEQEFHALKPRIVKLLEEQRKLTNAFLAEAKKKIEAGNTEEGGMALFRAYRGLPKYRPLIKYLGEQGIKQIMQKTENIYLSDNGRNMPEADRPLFFTIEEKNKSIDLTQNGIALLTGEAADKTFFVLPNLGVDLAKIEKDNSLNEDEKVLAKEKLIEDYSTKTQRIHIVQQLLKAYTMFEKDVDYIVADGKVKIVDEQTGRVLEGRRFSDGLHQALEAKENVHIEESTQTYATVTLQNYFRMYHKLAGMTGTAETEAGEFWDIYKLDVVVIPTNRKVVRADMEDKVYKTAREKYNAVAEEIQALTAAGRPVLVGTTSVENSELISRLLRMRNIQHQVLNAKQHAKEAEIVANAGMTSTVTIATNMAGRGTDIKLTPDSKKAGGLAIIGTERHESRRVDRQLRGRAGRQGDVGSSQFFVSLEDDLMRLFGSDRIASIMDKLGLEEGEVIQHSMITKSIERAQKKVEENNFAVRKRLLEYDDVMNMQREVVYKIRRNALHGERLGLDIMNMFRRVATNIAENYKGDFENYKVAAAGNFGFVPHQVELEEFQKGKTADIAQKLYTESYKHYQEKNNEVVTMLMPMLVDVLQQTGNDSRINANLVFTDGKRNLQMSTNLFQTVASQGKALVQSLEQNVVLALIDQLWKEHLRDMDDLRQQVQFASLEQKDPLLVYKFEAYKLFESFILDVNEQISSFLAKAVLLQQSEYEASMQDLENQQKFIEDMMREEQQQAPKQKLIEQKVEADQVHNAEDAYNTQQPKHQANQHNQHHNQPPVQQPPVTRPVTAVKIPNRNDKVTVQYGDGTVKKDVKFKSVEQDLRVGKCRIIE
jgi:preprotein translocase subunit SecA